MAQDMSESTRVMPASAMPGADKTMVAGAPAGIGAAGGAATVMGQTITCAVCRSNNPPMENYCVECGFLLASAPGAAAPAEEAESGVELTENLTGRRFQLKAGVNTVGRENSDILLMDGTVSRRHAQISVENGVIVVTDLGSTNGTQIDGGRLAPNQPTPLAPGSTVRFGNATLTYAAEAPAPEQAAAPAEPTLAVSVAPAPDALAEEAPAGEPPTESAALTGDAAEPFAAVEPQSESQAEPSAMAISTPPPVGGALAVAKLVPAGADSPAITLEEGTVTVGRRPGNTAVLAADPYVSGRHAEITCDPNGCFLVDVGSTNGTTVNGVRLEPGQRQLLLDGDEVSFGQTAYKFETLDLPDEVAAPQPPIAFAMDQPAASEPPFGADNE